MCRQFLLLFTLIAAPESLPAESQYAEMIRDMLTWSKDVPEWEKCWQLCQEKYREDPDYQKASNGASTARSTAPTSSWAFCTAKLRQDRWAHRTNRPGAVN